MRALGKTHDLLNLRTSATYVNQSAGSIARDLIGQAGLSAGTIDDGPVLPRYVVDRALSGYRHLKELADRLGYELYADRDGNIMFHPLGPAANLDALGGALGAVAGAAGGLLGPGGESYAFGQQLLSAATGSSRRRVGNGRGRWREPDIAPGRHHRTLADDGRRRLHGQRGRRGTRAARQGPCGAHQGPCRPLRRRQAGGGRPHRAGGLRSPSSAGRRSTSATPSRSLTCLTRRSTAAGTSAPYATASATRRVS